MANPTRRSILKAAPAALLIGAGGAQAAEPETEISRLFAKWKARYEDDAPDRSVPMDVLEAQIAALEPTSLRDYALKIIVWTVDGSELNGCHIDGLMLPEMRRLAGEAPMSGLTPDL